MAADAKTPVRLTLTCREEPYRIAMRARGLAEWRQSVLLDDDRAIDAKLQERGTLSVNAIPWAAVTLDGRALGHTPRLKVPIDPGRHHVKLVTAKGDTRMRTIEVSPGRETKVTVVFSDP